MKQFYATFIISVLICCSCQHIYYAPNTANAPLLSEKGEARVNALYCSGFESEFSGGELQAAYAVSNKMGVMINFFAAGRSENVTGNTTNTNRVEKGNGSYLEGAGGYFMTLDAKKNWIVDIYGGIGFGSVKNDYGFGDNSKVGITKFFVQPSIGYKSPWFEFAIVPKLSLINWKVKASKISSSENDGVRDELTTIKSDPSFVAFEPALLIRAGGKDFKVQAGFSLSNYNASDFFIPYQLTETLNGHIGISLNIKRQKK